MNSWSFYHNQNASYQKPVISELGHRGKNVTFAGLTAYLQKQAGEQGSERIRTVPGN